MIQEFPFNRAEPDRRFGFPKRWLKCLSDTRRFFRNRDGKILFLISEPDQFMQLTRMPELRGILDAGDVVQIAAPHDMDDSDYMELWHALFDNRWRLPSAADRHVAAKVRA